MTSLAIEQQALLDALFTRPQVVQPDSAINLIAVSTYYTGVRGIKAYINNGFSLAERTLLAAYPVMAQLLGEDSFALLARDFWLAHPPVRGDLAHWGAALHGLARCHSGRCCDRNASGWPRGLRRHRD